MRSICRYTYSTLVNGELMGDGGLQLVLGRSDGADRSKRLTDDDLEENRQNIDAAKERLRGLRDEQQTGTDSPDVPPAKKDSARVNA